MSTSNNPDALVVRPHRRISLTGGSEATRPTVPVEEPVAAQTIGASVATPDDKGFVRVVAYLSPDESTEFDMMWLQMRALAVSPTKADIVRAALKLAIADPKRIADFFNGDTGGEAEKAPRKPAPSPRSIK